MLRIRKSRLAMASVALAALMYVSGVASASLVEGILKVGGVSLLISKYGDDINNAFNKLTKTEQSEAVATKVLPIISVGSGASIGAVQVTGSRKQVAKTQAVIQIEGKVLGIRIRALIPSDSKKVTKINRVDGVGVSGLMDIKL